MSNSYIDYFKMFKIFDLKKLDKHGDVKLTHDKQLGRKVLYVEGNVSTQNYITFQTTSIPNLLFKQRYLYIIGCGQGGKNFCFQLIIHLNAKIYKILYSTVYKTIKMNQHGVLQMPLPQLKSSKWTIMVVDLYNLSEKYCETEEIRMTFRLANVIVRANSKVKGIYQSDMLYDPYTIPKQIGLPLKNEQFYGLYNYFICGQEKKEKSQKQVKKQEKQKKEKESPKKPKEKEDQKIQEQEQIRKKPINNRNSNKRVPKSKQKKIKQKKIEQVVNNEECQQLQLPRTHGLPKPKPTLSAKLCGVEGNSIAMGSIVSIQAFIVSPVVFPVHKPIKCIHHSHFKLVVGYVDGSICIWHSIKKTPLLYFKTQLIQIKLMQLIDDNLYVVGLDRMRREIISIINGSDMLFKQVSNYSIEGFKVIGNVILTYGYQNIRIWKIIQEKSLITGTSLYLGKMNQKVHYTSCCLIQNNSVALVTDSNGYITLVSLEEEKMMTMRKIDDNGLDHIVLNHNNQLLLVSKTGTIRVLNLQFECLMQMDLCSRIKHINYNPNNNQILQITHYNKSTSILNIQESEFSYVNRCHTDSVRGIGYSSKYSKIVSISDDQSIRVWSMGINTTINKKELPYMIKQEYQFVIKTHKPLCICVDNSNYAYVGFDSGKVDKIDIRQYKVVREQKIGSTILGIDVSKNNKNVLITYKDNEQFMVSLTDNKLNIVQDFRLQFMRKNDRIVNVLSGFNLTSKRMYICYVFKNGQSKVRIYSLSSTINLQLQFYSSIKPNNIKYYDHKLQVSSKQELQIYDDEYGEMLTLFNINSDVINYPIALKCIPQKYKLQVSIVSQQQKQVVDLPQDVTNMLDVANDEQRMVICSGTHSNSIYVIGYQARNLQELINQIQEMKEQQPQQQQLQFDQNKRQIIVQQSQQYNNQQQQQEQQFVKTKPKQFQLRNIYEKQEEMFQMCKDALLPSDQTQHHQQTIPNNHPYIAHNKQQQQQQSREGMQVKLYYGWQNRYNSHIRQNIVWLPYQQSAIFLNQNTLILHKFAYPVQQKHVTLPIQPTIIKEDKEYIIVTLGNQIRLYNCELVYIRCIGSVVGSRIQGVCVSGCVGYLVVLSSDSHKVYMQIIDIHTQNVISSSYLLKKEILPQSNSNSNNTGIKLVINPNKVSLQFAIITKTKILFYRLTSILTLQYQELQKIEQISNTIGQISSVVYCLQEILMIGLSDGSVVLVDARSGTILILIKNIIKSAIVDILVQQSMIVLIGQSLSSILSIQIQDYSLDSVVSSMSNVEKHSKTITTDSQVYSNSLVHGLGNDRMGMLLMTKLGVLWLVDLTANSKQTIKVICTHNNTVNKCIGKDNSIVSVGRDGNVYETSLTNLQQISQIYKPRRSVQDILINEDTILIAFNNELYFYGSGYEYMGNVVMDSLILSIDWIQESRTYVILTNKKLYLLLHLIPQIKSYSVQKQCLKVQLKQICVHQNNIQSLKTKPTIYSYGKHHLLLKQENKVSVWIKKKGRNNSNKVVSPIQQFNTTIYYLMDAYNTNTKMETVVDLFCISQTQYLVCLREEERVGYNAVTKLQWRDFNEHTLLNQMQINILSATMMYVHTSSNAIYIGDETGMLWLINHNGLTLEKIRVFNSQIRGMTMMKGSNNSNDNGNKAVVYGQSVAIIQY